MAVGVRNMMRGIVKDKQPVVQAQIDWDAPEYDVHLVPAVKQAMDIKEKLQARVRELNRRIDDYRKPIVTNPGAPVVSAIERLAEQMIAEIQGVVSVYETGEVRDEEQYHKDTKQLHIAEYALKLAQQRFEEAKFRAGINIRKSLTAHRAAIVEKTNVVVGQLLEVMKEHLAFLSELDRRDLSTQSGDAAAPWYVSYMGESMGSSLEAWQCEYKKHRFIADNDTRTAIYGAQ